MLFRSHTINNKFARQMRKEIRLHEIQAPSYDCNREPIMDVNRIREDLDSVREAVARMKTEGIYTQALWT